MGQIERDGEHLWLRQAVTFTADGQTRTLEIGVPVRLGASPEEIEAMLGEADGGMTRLTAHLDARIAAALGHPMPVPVPVPAEPPAAMSPSKVPAAQLAAEQPSPATPPAAAERPQPALAPAAPPAPTTPPRTAPAERAATSPAASGIRERPTPAATPPHPATSAASSEPLAIKDFIAAVQSELGLNPKQAMDQLGVKSLSGLNLREALEMLRRQALRGDDAGADDAGTAVDASSQSAPEAQPRPASTSVPVPTPAAPEPDGTPRYFEEEDDAADITYTFDEQDLAADAGAGYGAAEYPAEDDLLDELDELPDFGPPPPAPSRVRGRAPVRETAAKPQAAASEPDHEATAETPVAEPSRASRIIGGLRGMRAGGAPTTQQRTAYKNIVVAELGEPKVKSLIAGVWRTSPEKLGPEQLDALISWGKRDTFAEDVELVLAALRAEREQPRETQNGASAEAPEEESRPAAKNAAKPAAGSTARRAPRATPTGGA
ncbi:MAG TPA: hypothetical protein VFU88_20580 [Ktedonobacterales bacterium]|nr:hypothetical protein [Ktedonobacterales bacterium]